jgi:hypothetical protein
MLPTILQHSAQLVAFLALFNLALYQPQIRHLHQLVDAMLVCNGKKTLSNLYRQISGEPDAKTAADFFRESPWERCAFTMTTTMDRRNGRPMSMASCMWKSTFKLGRLGSPTTPVCICGSVRSAS